VCCERVAIPSYADPVPGGSCSMPTLSMTGFVHWS